MAPLEYELLPASASPSGQPRLRFKPGPLQYQAYRPLLLLSESARPPEPNARLHEIVARLGEICLSPELAHAMLFPAHALAYASGLTHTSDFPQENRDFCGDGPSILAIMAEPQTTAVTASQSAKFLAKFHVDCLPIPITTAFRQPIHVCAWKLEAPQRVCLFTGAAKTIDPATFSPHTLQKTLLEERSKRPSPSCIHLVAPDDISPSAVRTSLLHYAQTALTPYRARLPHPHHNALEHTLEEAVACLIHPPQRNHTQIELNQAPPAWDKEHIDSRYNTHTHQSVRVRGAGPQVLITMGLVVDRVDRPRGKASP